MTTAATPENTTTDEAPSQALAQKPASDMQKVPVRMGVAPATVEEGWRLATILAKSALVPKNFANKPEDVFVAIQMGVEIGLAPMQALQSIAVINGRPSLWGDGFLALIMASPLYQDHDEFYEVNGERRDGLTAEDLKKDTTTAVCTFRRRGKSTPVTRRFSVAQAKKADLIGKAGPWQTYPDRMLALRARGFAGRDAFPDLLRGIKTAEEMHDTPEPEVFDVTPVAAPKEPQRLSAQQPAATTAAAPVQAPAGQIVVGPAKVVNVEQKKEPDGDLYFVVTMSDGTKIETTKPDDAMELEKFKGTDHLVRLTCVRDSDILDLVTFVIAD